MQSETSSELGPQPFLLRDASVPDLLTACILNHVDWLRRVAAASGGTSHHRAGVFRADVPRPAPETYVVALERPGPGLRQDIDEELNAARQRGVHRFGYWLPDDTLSSPTAGYLGSRGLRPGSRPHWMAADLWQLPATVETPRDLAIGPVERLADWAAPGLTAFDRQTAKIRDAMAAARPRQVWNLALMEGGAPVGQTQLTATTGTWGVCGLHDTILQPQARSRGLGLERFTILCRFIMETGARYVVLNAAGTPPTLYRLLGFRALGAGQTWWATGQLLARPPSPAEVSFGDALADCDLDALERAVSTGRHEVATPLANGLTPLRFAAAIGQDRTAAWLIQHGAPLDPLSAWDLGWHSTVRELLANDQAVLNAQRPTSGKSLLHVAVERNDPGLVRLLLDVGIDTELRDRQFGATALEWARTLQRPLLNALLSRHTPGEHDEQ